VRGRPHGRDLDPEHGGNDERQHEGRDRQHPHRPAGRPRAPEDAHVPDPDGGQGEPGTGQEQERLDDVLPQRVPACMGENVHQALSMK
jgi:hypothetical protein